jgi:hypothetical protein
MTDPTKKSFSHPLGIVPERGAAARKCPLFFVLYFPPKYSLVHEKGAGELL